MLSEVSAKSAGDVFVDEKNSKTATVFDNIFGTLLHFLNRQEKFLKKIPPPSFITRLILVHKTNFPQNNFVRGWGGGGGIISTYLVAEMFYNTRKNIEEAAFWKVSQELWSTIEAYTLHHSDLGEF